MPGIIVLHERRVTRMGRCNQVGCSVENCQYNEDRMCHADRIDVNAMGDGKAETCDGTCCSTFKNKK